MPGTKEPSLVRVCQEAPSGLQKQKILRRGSKNTQKNCTEKIFKTNGRTEADTTEAT